MFVVLFNVRNTMPTSKNGILRKAGEIQNSISSLKNFATQREKVELEKLKLEVVKVLGPLFSSPELQYATAAKRIFEISVQLSHIEKRIESNRKFFDKKLN